MITLTRTPSSWRRALHKGTFPNDGESTMPETITINPDHIMYLDYALHIANTQLNPNTGVREPAPDVVRTEIHFTNGSTLDVLETHDTIKHLIKNHYLRQALFASDPQLYYTPNEAPDAELQPTPPQSNPTSIPPFIQPYPTSPKDASTNSVLLLPDITIVDDGFAAWLASRGEFGSTQSGAEEAAMRIAWRNAVKWTTKHFNSGYPVQH